MLWALSGLHITFRADVAYKDMNSVGIRAGEFIILPVDFVGVLCTFRLSLYRN